MTDRATLRHVSSLDSMECMDAEFRKHSFPRHSHDTYVIEYVDSGTDGFFCRNSDHVASAGQFVLINPHEVHTGSAMGSGVLRYRSLYPTVAALSEVQRHFSSTGVPWMRDTVVSDPALARRFHRFWLSMDDEPVAVQENFFEMMFQLIRNHSTTGGNLKSVGPERLRIRKVREYLHCQYPTRVSLDDLSQISGLSPFHLLRSFRRETGMPPHEYLTSLRIEKAKRLLRAGTSIAQTAFETGFSDQSHLTRSFKRIIGVTPGQYLLAVDMF